MIEDHDIQNHAGVILGSALSAAERIHIAMCQIRHESAAADTLLEAMHSALIVAEQARQMYRDVRADIEKRREEEGA